MRRTEEIEAVRNLAPFEGMRAGSFDELVERAFFQRFPAGVVVLEQGQPPEMLHIVVEGAVEMYGETAGCETTIAIFHPLSAFILAAVMTDQPHLMSARTLETTRLLMIPAPVIHDLMESDSAFALAMATELARGFRTMVKTAKNLKLRDAAPRVANYLLALRDEKGADETMTLPYGRNVIASLLGITRESLSRVLPMLRAHGIVVQGRHVTFRDLAKARAFAQPDPLIDSPHT